MESENSKLPSEDNINKNSSKNSNNSPKGQNPKLFFIILSIALVVTFVYNFVFFYKSIEGISEIYYSDFVKMVDEGKVKKVEIQSAKLIIYPDTQKLTKEDKAFESKGETVFTGRIADEKLTERLEKNNVEFFTPITETNPVLNFFIYWILPTLFTFVGFFVLMKFMGRSGLFGVGKSNAKVYMQKETGVTFDDVAGQDEAKESLVEIVDFLHNPEKYSKIGAKQPKGALLVGPPGTGKTLLAKAVAGEANVTFLSLSGSDFEEMYVGVGASRVRDLFKQANQNAPCIVFIDEIDAVGKSRNDENNYSEQTLNQLLSEMDGFDASKGVCILGATNRPEVLDKALLRPGRFDRRIIVEKPDLIGRENILKVHIRGVVINENNIDLHKVALATSGAVGADLANIVNEAALRAVRLGREEVIQEDLMESIEVIFVGKEKKDRLLSDKEKKIVAYHEVGHALVSAVQKDSKPVEKINIVPRTMGALGYVLHVPEDEKYLDSKSEILAEITTFYGGRAAEEIIFNEITTGAAQDIESATKLARRMVTRYGMSDKFDMMAIETIKNQYLDGRAITECSNDTMADVDKEVLNIIKDCHKKAKDIINENIDMLHKIAEYLIEKETITGEEFMEIFKGENSSDKPNDNTKEESGENKQ